MRRYTVTVAILLSVLALAARPLTRPASGQKPSDDRPRAAQGGEEEKQQQEAEALLMIVGNPLSVPDWARHKDPAWPTMADNAIPWLIRHWSEQTGQRAELAHCKLFTHLSVSPEGHTVGIITVSGRGDIAKSLALAVKRLEEALVEIHRLSMEPLQRKIDLAQKRTARAEVRIGQVAQELQQLRKVAMETGEALQPQDPQLFASVRRDQLTLRAEIAGLQAQREAIIEGVTMAKDKLDDARNQQQLLLDELAKVVKLHEDAVARTRKLLGNGVATPTELSKAEVALAQARADLADRRRMLVQEAGGGQLSRLNEKLVETQIAITTSEARLKETVMAIEELKRSAYSPASPLVINYERTRRAMEHALAEQEAAAAELARLEMTRDATPVPKVILIPGEGKPK